MCTATYQFAEVLSSKIRGIWPLQSRLRIQLGVNMPARADRVHKRSEEQGSKNFEGELFGESHDVVLYFGIIDILQNYSFMKRIEHAYKACHFDSTSISAVEPKLYSKRFQKFIQKIFPPTYLWNLQNGLKLSSFWTNSAACLFLASGLWCWYLYTTG